MQKIGVVLAGGASKGAYEIGVMRAIEDYFGKDNIHCVSSSSIGAIIAQGYGMGKVEELANLWKNLDTKKHGRFTLAYSGNKDLLKSVDNILETGHELSFEHYVCVWNYTKRKVEYLPFHTLSREKQQKYLHGAVAIPFFSAGEVIDGNRILDGAFLDNIPAFPLLQKDLDYIFCVYFDNCNYQFENDEFDKKIIKLYDFPNIKRLELMSFNADSFDKMVQFGYDYAMKIIKKIFVSDDKNEIYKAIADYENSQDSTYKPRLTVDIVLDNINVLTKKYAKRISLREKKKKNTKHPDSN